MSVTAYSASVPGPADTGRIQEDKKITRPSKVDDAKLVVPTSQHDLAIPEAARNVSFSLESVQFSGVTVFTVQELEELYSPYKNKKVTLDVVWIIANKLTDMYRERGYFLSRAVVPPQEIENGPVRINVVEGYISGLHNSLLFFITVSPRVGKAEAINRLKDHALDPYL